MGAIQYLSKYIESLSAQRDILRQLLKKDNDWNWTTEHTKAFESLKQKNHRDIVSETLQFRLSKHNYHRPKHKNPRSYALARTTGWKIKTDQIRQSLPFGHGNEIRNQRTGIIGGGLGFRTPPLIYLRKTDKITHRSPSTRAFN